jgi:hypothetical protein
LAFPRNAPEAQTKPVRFDGSLEHSDGLVDLARDVIVLAEGRIKHVHGFLDKVPA